LIVREVAKSLQNITDTCRTVAEVIALKLRRPESSNEYLYPQIFAGLSCVIASACLLELWRVKNGGKLTKVLNERRRVRQEMAERV
jgi:hypothetical protein